MISEPSMSWELQDYAPNRGSRPGQWFDILHDACVQRNHSSTIPTKENWIISLNYGLHWRDTFKPCFHQSFLYDMTDWPFLLETTNASSIKTGNSADEFSSSASFKCD